LAGLESFAATVARWLERRARLSQIIRRNREIGREIQGDVFRAKSKVRKRAPKNDNTKNR
jgi:hypothetical protein